MTEDRPWPGLAWPGVNEDVENAAWVHQLALGRTRWGGTCVPATIGNRHQVGLGVTAATSLVVLKCKGRWHPVTRYFTVKRVNMKVAERCESFYSASVEREASG